MAMDRAERRRREKADERFVARGIDVARRDLQQVASLMRLVHREVLKAHASGTVEQVFTLLYGNLAKTARQAPNDLVACGRACSHCCMMWVSATAPEVFHLARAVRRSKRDVPAILTKCGATAGLDFDERATFIAPCPVHAEDGGCSAYASRPMACRTAASSDADVCRRGYLELSGENIPTPFFFMAQRTGYYMALRGAFLQAGLRLETYELNEALSIALTVPDAERRWLAGEDIFAGVLRDPNENPIDQAGVAPFVASVFA